jgi:hypothetical protein
MIARLPAPGGPHPVGLRIVEFCAGARRAQAYVWYPAEAADGPRRALHTPREAEAFAAAFAALGAAGHANRAGSEILTNTTECAPPREGRWPLVVFNHGGALDPLANVTLMEELASAGYIAASLGHAGESAGLVWKDGSTTPIDPALLARMQLPRDALEAFARMLLARSTVQRCRQLAAFRARDPGVLAKLARDWAGDAMAFADLMLGPHPPPALARLAQMIGPDRVAYAGMSLGGAAAHVACRADPRARAGVNLDGTLWDFAAAGTGLGTAFLDIGAEAARALPQLKALAGPGAADRCAADVTRANDVHFADWPRSDIVRLEIAGTGHDDFTDRPLIDALVAGSPDPATCAIRNINRLCRTFFDWTVKGEGPAAFDAAVAASPAIRRLTATT